MSTGTILDTIADSTRARVAALKATEPLAALTARAERARAERAPLSFLDAFADQSSPRVIAEVKFASPSEGDIMKGGDAVAVADEYLSNGAAALSVLTEPQWFKGDFKYLTAIRRKHPQARLLMKDFIVEEYQLHLAVALGADAALILLAMLPFEESRKLYEKAVALGLTPLVEVHDDDELKLAADLGAKLIGVNNRNLKTMKVSLGASERLAAAAPPETTLISESGIRTRAEIDAFMKIGYRGFLIGTSFMRTGKPGAALASLLKGTP